MTLQDIVKARVRGIYATAITKILLDQGIMIVQATPIIRQRLNIPENNAAPDVTVKTTDDDPHTLLIIGFPKQVDTVSSILEEYVGYYIKWESKIGLYSIVKGIIESRENNECNVKLPYNLTGILRPCENNPGDEVLVSVAKTRLKPGEPIKLVNNIRVIGYYAAIIEGESKVTISEHIRSYDKRAELLMLASNITREGLGVHWRSSAAHASPEALLKEVNELREKLKELKKIAEKTKAPELIYPGEKIVLLTLPSKAKYRLDYVRAEVTATTPYHHSAKALGDELAIVVDYAEKLIANKWLEPNRAFQGILEYIADKIKESKRIEIQHIKPDGKILRLTPGKPESIIVKEDHIVIELRRTFKTQGIYDGLGIEKEPGDYDIMRIDTSSWLITHRYYDYNGNLKGEYININTPPEVSTNRIVYHDLALDVVKVGDKVEIIDVNEYVELLKNKVISPAIHEKIVEELHKLGIDLEKYLQETLKSGK